MRQDGVHGRVIGYLLDLISDSRTRTGVIHRRAEPDLLQNTL